LAFEVTDVIQTDRRRREEYKNASRVAALVNRESATSIDLDFELNDVLVALEHGLHNKPGKHFHPDTCLVLNVTHFVYRSDIQEMRHSLIEITRTALTKYREVWLLFSSMLILVTADEWIIKEIDKAG